MTNAALPRLARPRLLARAARIGASLYERERDLPAALPGIVSRRALVPTLAAAEAACDAERRAGAPSYNPGRHVKLLAALLAEASAAAAATAQSKAA